MKVSFVLFLKKVKLIIHLKLLKNEKKISEIKILIFS